MLIIKNAVPQVARMKAVRSLLTRIDVNRERDRYDIYFTSDQVTSMQIDYVSIYDQRYLNVRIRFKSGAHGSFQVNTRDFDYAQLI